MKVGDLVYSGHMMEIGHTVLGIVVRYRAGRSRRSREKKRFILFFGLTAARQCGTIVMKWRE